MLSAAPLLTAVPPSATPVLSFWCSVMQLTHGAETTRRRTWIDSATFPALARAAAREIAPAPEACTYMLVRPEGPHRSVFVEVIHDRTSALIGPMSGPRPPEGFAIDRCYGFEEFLFRLGFTSDPAKRPPRAPGAPAGLAGGDAGDTADGGAVRDGGDGGKGGDRKEDEPPEGMYPVTVRFAGIWGQAPSKWPLLVRGERESGEAFRRRRGEDDRRRVERTQHEGLHVVSYPIPPTRWQARDLERLMGIVYGLLPGSEPRWRQSGALLHEPVAESSAGGGLSRRRMRFRHRLELGRGEYVATLRLPRFPAAALVEWLEARPCEIALCHAVDLLETDAERWSALGAAGPGDS